ncbi:kinase-like domain-containing protein [Rhizophagus irregularis DAOM 181602=DAOM 197198]|uniref:Kinase-like domain-containing protein n=1 Tax=Rhizophagus irregularis (strain DAOM 181602 / DAOM 197198 / MUCL 43194) TaxID=747089 RepID=A0A2P4PGM0_RHIID|nr:kinase-like domain-containing protein [Rhizophagus irregularis DAOM 181602=DAOM 197198]POG64544.1 kinase-like domain-containing protein [Rhizophagus irregularis DAOM 181602=DAOM 197198]|eukprot:XP_025171410.1 kinase-like domain-containing protein [Rhizophagus irregularis DAOM 181602=DAOM 197198]
MQNNENINEWTNWIEEAIIKQHIKYYEYENFKNVQEVGSGAFGKVFRANWKNFGHLALKSFYNLNDITLKEIVNELKLQREVDFHDNIIRFYGITKFESENKIDQTKNYLLVMEYANGGTLRDYLNENFNRLSWDDRYNLAHQLACSVLCLHDEGIVHRDLHSCNVLVHKKSIKLADFGLSKRIDEASNSQSKLLGMVPYIDPKVLMNSNNLKLNEKSDVYSIGVLLWEISSGKPPFHEEKNKIGLIYDISQGRREEIIPDTPNDYSNLYIECWNNEPSKRPNMHEVVNRLGVFIPDSNSTTIDQQNDISDQTYPTPNENLTPNSAGNSSHGELSQMIQNFTNMNTSEIDSMSTKEQINENISSENYFSIVINEIVDLIFKENIKDNRNVKQHVIDYLNNHNVNSKEIYNWLLNNQNNSESIFLLGYFNYVGIGSTKDEEKAFNLFINASKQDHTLAQYCVGLCYQFGNGITKNEKLAFEYYEKVANKDYANGQFKLGWFYKNGVSVNKDLKMAVYWYEKAADNGHLKAMHNLGLSYENGDGVDKNNQKAFELFKQSAEGGHSGGIMMLAYCYGSGIGINIDRQKAVELYQKAANLGSKVAQYNLANMYKAGVGIEKDLDKAIYWYEQSAKQGYIDAQTRLKELKKN